jgi:hypothetical protein
MRCARTYRARYDVVTPCGVSIIAIIQQRSTMNVRLVVLSAALAATALGTVASAQQQFPANPAYNNQLRGGRGSDRNLRTEIRRLEQVIDMLQRDQRDYGGHRVQAIQDLQQARQQLEDALEYDNTHGHR